MTSGDGWGMGWRLVLFGSGAGGAAGAGIFCGGESGDGDAGALRSGGDGAVFAGFAACAVGFAGMDQGLCAQGGSKTAPILTGIPAAVLEQTRETLDAQVSFQFLSWTKLTMALATGFAAYESAGAGCGRGCCGWRDGRGRRW
jgi:hypothetical protein